MLDESEEECARVKTVKKSSNKFEWISWKLRKHTAINNVA